MNICSNAECNLDTYDGYDECILHCSKKELDFFQIRLDFYNSLKNYVAENSIDGNDFCHFFGIAFPKPDVQSKINYVKILASLKQMHFDNCHFFTGYIDLNDHKFFFQDCYFHDDWTIRNYKLLKNVDDVIYQGCTFLKEVNTYTPDDTWLYKYDHSQFDFTCVFKRKVTFYRAMFALSPFNGNQDNYKDNTLFKLLIEKCEFSTFEIYLKNQENGEVEFKKSTIKSKLKIRSEECGDYEKQQSNKSKLKTLKIIDCHVDDNAYIRIGYLEIDNFIISNLRNPQNSELNIGDCHFKNYVFSNFRNIGRFKLYKINVFGDEKGSLFQIDNTSIGDADFQAICLTSFTTVRLFDNIFANIRYTNMQWKEVVEVGQYHDGGITEIAKKRDTYRVLKNIAHDNNDQPQALLFYAREMQYHKKLTLESRCNKKDFKRYFIRDLLCKDSNGWLKDGRLQDIATLYFNEKTNNFGLNWWQPIKLIILSSVIFYSFFLFSLDVDNTHEYWKNIFEFINPTHSIGFIAKENWTIYSFSIDFMYRIIEGLLIYQTVVAFRKFSKK